MKKKTLIITTGFAKVILTRWLPLLRTVGDYQGDVLAICYGDISYVHSTPIISEAISVIALKEQPNVIVLQPLKKLAGVYMDRVMVYRDYILEHSEYDCVLIMDGNDTIFWGSIQPLIAMAKKKLCYIKEHAKNKLKIWNDFYLRDWITKTDYYSIGENPIINAGVLGGPIKNILEYLQFMKDMIQVYGDAVSDQVYLDILIYYYKYPAREVGYEWNYTHAIIAYEDGEMRFIKPTVPIIKDGKAYAETREGDDGRQIFIEHRTGTGYWFWLSLEGYDVLNNSSPIPVNAEYGFPKLHRMRPKSGTWLFPTDNSNLPQQRTYTKTHLFPR